MNKKNVQNAWKEKLRKLSQNVNLSDLKIIDYITNSKDVEKDVLSQNTD